MGTIGCGPASDQGVCREDHPENEIPMLPLRDSAKNFIYPTNLSQCGKPNKRVGPGAWSQRCFRGKDDMGGELITSKISCSTFQNCYLRKNERGTEYLPVAPAPYPPPLCSKVPGAAQHTSTRCSAACSRETTATNIYSKTHIFLKNINMIKIQRKTPKEVHHSTKFSKRSKPRVIFRKERTDLLFDMAPPLQESLNVQECLKFKKLHDKHFFLRQI